MSEEERDALPSFGSRQPMTESEIAAMINEVLSANCVQIHCITMHEYSIEIDLDEFEIMVCWEVEILWNDGTSVVVDADYHHRTDQSFSILRLVGRKVLSCHFDHDESLVFEVSGGDYFRCVAKEPVESYQISGIAAMPLLLLP